jgi:hypothetical protein
MDVDPLVSRAAGIVPPYSAIRRIVASRRARTISSRSKLSFARLVVGSGFGPKLNGKGVCGNFVPDVRWNLEEACEQ